jgi:hypothetical protein
VSGGRAAHFLGCFFFTSCLSSPGFTLFLPSIFSVFLLLLLKGRSVSNPGKEGVMPAWIRSVTCRLYPHPVDEMVNPSSGNKPCSWMCREQVQKYDNFTRRVTANIDTTCSDVVICAINVSMPNGMLFVRIS